MSDIDKNATPKPDPGNVESRKLKTALSVARVAFLTKDKMDFCENLRYNVGCR